MKTPDLIRRFVKRDLAALISIAGLSLLLCNPVWGTDTITTQAAYTLVRRGAGNYYEITSRVPKGTRFEVIADLGEWYKVKLPDGKPGFVSRISLIKRKRRTLRYHYDSSDSGAGKVAAPVVIAATKGITEITPFTRKYAQKYEIDPAILETMPACPFTPAEFASFRKKLPRRNQIADGLSRDGMDDYDKEIGKAIALRLCSAGVSTDAKLRKYVSLVGTALLEHTPLYDEDFLFIVLESPEARSFSAPGGYVFITTGALKEMKNEAELAGVLSHEIVHIVQRHGIKEMEKQKTRIQANEAMDSLDSEVAKLGMDRGDAALMDQLDRLTDEMYESVISGRKIEAEDEADRLGTIVLSNTGYAPDGLKLFLAGLKDEKRSPDHRSIGQRIRNIDLVINRNRLTSGRSRTYLENRFDSYTR